MHLFLILSQVGKTRVASSVGIVVMRTSSRAPGAYFNVGGDKSHPYG